MRKAVPVVVVAFLATAPAAQADRMIWTREGGIADGPAAAASLDRPFGLLDAGGGDLYLSDVGDHAIRRYDASSGRVRTLAGDGQSGFAGDGGPFARARFGGPIAIAGDRAGLVYVSDFANQRIRVLNPTGRSATTGGVTVAPGEIETLAGDGDVTEIPAPPPDRVPARQTSMAFPRGVAVDAAGNVFYCDIDNLMVRVIWNTGPRRGTVETYAGRGWPEDFDTSYPGDHGDGGLARDMLLSFPSAVTVGPDGDLYVAEWSTNRDTGQDVGVVWRIDHRDRTVHRVAGTGLAASGGDGGPALDAGLENNVQSLVFDPRGNLYISQSHAIRRVSAATGRIGRYAGRDGEFAPTFSSADAGRPAAGATLVSTTGMAWAGGDLHYADADAGVIRRVDSRGIVRDVIRGGAGIKGPFSAAIDGADRLFVTEFGHGRIRRVDPDGSLSTVLNLPDVDGADAFGPALFARSGQDNGVTVDERGNLFFTDGAHSRIVEIEDGLIREIARFAAPFEEIADQIAVHGGKAYVGEPISGSVVEVDVATGARRTLTDGIEGVDGLAFDGARHRLWVADQASGGIFGVDPVSGKRDLLADLPESVAFSTIHLALSGDRLFAAGEGDNRVYAIDLAAADPAPEPFAGVEQTFPQGSSGDGGAALGAQLGAPDGIAVDSAGKVVIAERASGRVRVIGTSDIRPRAFPNLVRRGSRAAISVAIEGNPSFDATRLVPSSVTVAGLPPLTATLADVNGDRRADLVVTVREGDLARRLGGDASEAAIRGRLRDESAFRDADWVTVVG